MISYYKTDTEGNISAYTNFSDVAEKLHYDKTTERNIVFGYDGKLYFEGEEPSRPDTVGDYDRAMEAHLKAEQTARGYTTRSPAEYSASTNARWRQDAADWVAHVTAVMEYALEIENKHERGETVPTLDEFKAALPDIVWTYTAS